MNKLNFHEFYDYIWGDEIISMFISREYIAKNEEFIRNYTLDLFRFYEMSGVLKPKYFKKLVEITFTNLIAFKPSTNDIKTVSKDFNNSYEDY